MHGDLDNHEELLSSLKASATPLIDICNRDVGEQIETIVQETIEAWQETSANLTKLCEKYQRAVRLWNNYKTATEELNLWLEDRAASLETMDTNESLRQIEVNF